MPVIDNKALNRFELEENGHLALATYRRHEHSVSIPHVEADPALRGTGASGRLMQGIVEMARRERFSITPTCPFAKDWFSKHPEASDVLG
ncbi:MAG TPA: GNAT family N-acetyltransferase [Rhizomicrobium sp.]|nr:GNAT family N-acetyltransferase [Rhizomicrobium sp.]